LTMVVVDCFFGVCFDVNMRRRQRLTEFVCTAHAHRAAYQGKIRPLVDRKRVKA